MGRASHKKADSTSPIILEPRKPQLALYSRAANDGRWTVEEIAGIEAALDLPGLGVTLPLAQIYRGVALD